MPMARSGGTRSVKANGLRLLSLTPSVAMPGGEVELHGVGLQAAETALPSVTVGETSAVVAMSRADRAVIRVSEAAITGDVILERRGTASNALELRVAVRMANGLHRWPIRRSTPREMSTQLSPECAGRACRSRSFQWEEILR